ncbi:hypothetical protein [Rhodopirellula europaea]|uniref:hypothetical protein n=1 Tax=Rhodopirellula europaea TaxID=1263866 RepID=UPI003D2E4D61
MTQTTNNKPAATVAYGLIKGVIWGNPGKDDKPPFYSVQYTRSYTDDDGNWKDTHSFSEIDNLKLQYLIPKVTERILELKAADRKATNAE